MRRVQDAWWTARMWEPARFRAAWTAVLVTLVQLGITVPAGWDAKGVAISTALSVIVPLLQGEATRAVVKPDTERISPSR